MTALTNMGQPARQVSCGEASRGRRSSNIASRSSVLTPLCGRAARAPEHDAWLALIVTESSRRKCQDVVVAASWRSRPDTSIVGAAGGWLSRGITLSHTELRRHRSLAAATPDGEQRGAAPRSHVRGSKAAPHAGTTSFRVNVAAGVGYRPNVGPIPCVTSFVIVDGVLRTLCYAEHAYSPLDHRRTDFRHRPIHCPMTRHRNAPSPSSFLWSPGGGSRPCSSLEGTPL